MGYESNFEEVQTSAEIGEDVTVDLMFRAFPPPGAEQVTWQCGGESGFFGGFSDGEEAGIELHPGQTNGKYVASDVKDMGDHNYRVALAIENVTGSMAPLSLVLDIAETKQVTIPINIQTQVSSKVEGGSGLLPPPPSYTSNLPTPDSTEGPGGAVQTQGLSIFIIIGVIVLLILLCCLFF